LGQGEEGTAFSTATPIDPDGIDGAGCANLNATIFSPESGERVSGEVYFKGVANIPGFAFYKLEFNDLKPSGIQAWFDQVSMRSSWSLPIHSETLHSLARSGCKSSHKYAKRVKGYDD
jgi:hypothetical protein